MFKWKPLALVWASAVAALVIGAPARAQDEAAYFKGKTIRFIVGFGTGGGYDAYARMLAPHLSRALDATVIVENQPGAGGLTALARLATSPGDGLNLEIVNGTGAALAQLVGQQGARYDLGDFGHLGTVSASPWMWLVKPNSPYKTVKDALASKDKVNFAAGGPMDGLSDGAAFTCAALKLNCQVVLGYKGSADAVLAVTRGEMDAIYVSDTSANNYVKSGQAIAVASMGKTKSRFFPDIPTIFEATQLDAESKWLFDFRATVEDLGRILVVAPGTPAPRLAFLQDAVKKVLNDKAVIDEGEKTQRYIDYVDPEKTRAAVLAVVKNLSADQKERVKKILLPNG